MKRNFLFVFISLFGAFFLNSQDAKAQFFKRLHDAVKQTAEDHAINKAENETDKALDKVDDPSKWKEKNQKEKNNQDDDSQDEQDESAPSKASNSSTPSIKTYKNYDFVPGDTVIFESNLADERIGEIPSQFTQTDGQMDVQEEDGENVIHTVKGSGADFTPRMKSNQYLPDRFTVEFDFKDAIVPLDGIAITFGDGDNVIEDIQFNGNDGTYWTSDARFPEELSNNIDANPNQWHHIAIAVNKSTGKVYVDQYRVLSVNNLTGKADNINFEVHGYRDTYIKNIRIAAGGIDIYKKVTTDGKIIMHGILFDVDKATLKPESMGSINEIYYLLKKDPSLKFEIDGHTDNTGEAAHNLTLSQQRADAVKAQLVKMGIDGSRLSTKGFGDTKPISDNSTPEGKANNRRVEFVKM